jgi:hypothetical protein
MPPILSSVAIATAKAYGFTELPRSLPGTGGYTR